MPSLALSTRTNARSYGPSATIEAEITADATRGRRVPALGDPLMFGGASHKLQLSPDVARDERKWMMERTARGCGEWWAV